MTVWTRGTVAVSYGELVYHRTGGDKPPLILAHGLTDNGLCWRRVAEELQSDFDVVMLDSAGHGGSSLPVPGSFDDPATDILGVIEQLQLRSPALMGHSLGARALAMFANEHPKVPSRLVLEEPPFVTGAEKTSSKREAAFKEHMLNQQQMDLAEIIALGRTQHPTWHEDDFRDWAEANQQVNPDILAHYQFPPWQEMLNKIVVPTLLIYGSPGRDAIVTAEIAAEAQATNANIDSVCIADAGHNIRRENLEDFLATVRSFLLQEIH